MPDEHIKRCDVRFPRELYEDIEKIAVEEYNAPIYHKTGLPQVSATIIELVKLGIANLRGDISDNLPDNKSDRLHQKIQELEKRMNSQSSASLSDDLSDTVKTLVNEKIDSLKQEFQPILDAHKETEELLEKLQA